MNDLRGTLDRLVSASLLRKVLTEADPAYKFRHTLDQQTAYHSLLRKDRELIHKVVGLSIERDTNADVGILAPVLAEHFSVAGDDQRALKYYMMAGDEATRVYAHTEAIAYYQKALATAEEAKVAGEILRELYLRRGRTLELSGDYQAALENYRRLEHLGKTQGDISLELAGLTRQTILLVAPSAVADPKAGEELAMKLLELAASAEDREAEARGHWSLLLASIYSGRMERAIAEGKKALKLARELGLDELEAYILNDMAGPYMLMGGPDQARAVLDSAIEIWQRIGNLPMLVDSLGNLNSSLIYSGEFDRALENSKQAGEIADRIDNPWAKAFSLFLIELVHAEQGNLDQAMSTCEKQIRWGKQAGFKIPEVYSNAFMAWIYAYLGAFEQAEPCLEESAKVGPQLGEMWGLLPVCMSILVNLKKGELKDSDSAILDQAVDEETNRGLMNSPVGPYWWLTRGENALARGRLDSGIESLIVVVERERASDFHVMLADVFELLARLHRAAGDRQAAYKALDQAEQEAAFLSSRRMRWVIHAERALWMEKDGDAVAAAAERQRAQPDFEYVANHLGDESLRKTFIESAWVQGLRLG